MTIRLLLLIIATGPGCQGVTINVNIAAMQSRFVEQQGTNTAHQATEGGGTCSSNQVQVPFVP